MWNFIFNFDIFNVRCLLQNIHSFGDIWCQCKQCTFISLSYQLAMQSIHLQEGDNNPVSALFFIDPDGGDGKDDDDDDVDGDDINNNNSSNFFAKIK